MFIKFCSIFLFCSVCFCATVPQIGHFVKEQFALHDVVNSPTSVDQQQPQQHPAETFDTTDMLQVLGNVEDLSVENLPIIYLVIFGDLAKQRNVTLNEFILLFKLGAKLGKQKEIAEDTLMKNRADDTPALDAICDTVLDSSAIEVSTTTMIPIDPKEELETAVEFVGFIETVNQSKTITEQLPEMQTICEISKTAVTTHRRTAERK